jgi:hypothetical protein
VPLRHICWLLLAVVGGTAIGFTIGLPGSGGTVSASPSSALQEAAAGLSFAPATQRRPVKPVGLYTGRAAPVGLEKVSPAQAQSASDTTDAANVSAATPYARDLTFMAFPSGSNVPVSAAPAGATTTTTPTPTTTSSAPSGPPPAISNVRTVALTPFSATLSWQTSEAARSRVVYGLDVPVLWTAPTPSGTAHQITVPGLSAAT